MTRRQDNLSVLNRDHITDRCVIAASGCWVWTGNTDARGYGRLNFNRKYNPRRLGAHRVAYELWHGPIPDGMSVCHRCDNTSCVNPDHLFVGTHAENMADMARKGRATGPHFPARGVAHGSAVLTNEQVIEIRHLRATTSATQKEIGKRFGVSGTMVGKIERGEAWGWL